MQEKPENQDTTYPVLPLRDVVVYPHMVIPLFVGREKSVKALDRAMEGNKQILLVAQKSAVEDDPEIVAIAEKAADPQRAVFEGWRQAKGPSWRSLNRLERRLATARPSDGCWAEATRLRVQWRVRSGEPRLAQEAVAMLDILLARDSVGQDMVLRARATLAAGETIGTLSTLDVLRKQLKPTVRGRRTAQAVLTLLRAIPKDKARQVTAAFRARIRRRAMMILEQGITEEAHLP